LRQVRKILASGLRRRFMPPFRGHDWSAHSKGIYTGYMAGDVVQG
jgi:hypothetical protein